MLFFYSCAFANPLLDTALVRSYGGKGMDVGRDIEYTADGGFIIAGTTGSFGSGNTAIYLLKVDSNGIFQWSKAIGGIGVEWGYSVKQTFDKGYAVAGYTNSAGNGGYDIYLVKTDSVGNTLWEKTYGGSNWDFGYCIQQTPDSGFVLCGETYSFGNGNADAFIVKTTKNGDTLWTRAIGSDSTDVAYSIIVYNDSTYCFTGKTNGAGSGGDDILWGTINKQGAGITTKTFGSTFNDAGYCIEKTPDGGTVIMGETDSSSFNNQEELIMKIRSDQTLEWIHCDASNSTDIGRAVKVRSNGGFITCGISNASGSGGFGLHMQRLNSGGWWESGPVFGGALDEEGYAVVITPTNEVAFVGSTYSYGQGLQDVYFVKLKSDSIVMNYKLDVIQFNDTTLSPLAVQEYGTKQNVRIYPNPFSESAALVIENWRGLNIKSADLRIYDVLGREVQRSEIKNRQSEISRKNLENGVYFFRIVTSREIIAEGKFVIH